MIFEVVVNEDRHLVVDLIGLWVEAVVDVKEEDLPVVTLDTVGRCTV